MHSKFAHKLGSIRAAYIVPFAVCSGSWIIRYHTISFCSGCYIWLSRIPLSIRYFIAIVLVQPSEEIQGPQKVCAKVMILKLTFSSYRHNKYQSSTCLHLFASRNQRFLNYVLRPLVQTRFLQALNNAW